LIIKFLRHASIFRFHDHNLYNPLHDRARSVHVNAGLQPPKNAKCYNPAKLGIVLKIVLHCIERD
jgi:hypothetical protein